MRPDAVDGNLTGTVGLRSHQWAGFGWVNVLAWCALGACNHGANGAGGRTPGGPGGALADARPPVVTAATVERRDVPVFLDGLGNVAAYYTATVHTQVDGPLVRVVFTEGQMVHRGETLAQIDPRPFVAALHEAQGALARDRGLLVANQRTLDRDLGLLNQHYVAPQDVDTQRGLVDQYAGSVQADEAAIETARLNLEYTRVLAPIDGLTGVRQVDPGNLVHPTDPTGIVVITQVDRVAVFCTLPEDDLPEVNRGMSAGPLTVQVYSRDGGTLLGTGAVALVDNEINQQTATIRIKAVLPNPERALWPSQFVKVRVMLAPRRGALVIPTAAIQRGPQGSFVYIIAADNHVSIQSVTVDRMEGDTAVVLQGLSEGQRVVVEGQARLRPGATVSVHAPDAADGGVARPTPQNTGRGGHVGHGAPAVHGGGGA